MKTQTFTVTEEHLKLLRRFQVGWQDCETGAPEIDPKRPYGNSAVPKDIHEILTGETIGCTDSKREELTDAETHRYEKLHRETETALRIALATGQFKAGKYECEAYSTEWRECSNAGTEPALNREQISILDHTEHRAARGLYCGGGKEMDSLVALGMMESAGRAAWCPDEYFRITGKGRTALRQAQNAEVSASGANNQKT